ncbi:MAG: hypothetical protein ACREA0_00435 [bacterium]
MFRVEFDGSGFDEFARRLRALPNGIPFSELFTTKFMSAHTQVPSFEALLEAGGYAVTTTEEFAAIPDVEWDQVIRKNTSFDSSTSMQQAAITEYLQQRLTG